MSSYKACFGAVGFPARAGTSPEGHEEACTTTDRVHEHRSTAPRGRRLDSLARCCAPDAGSYTIYSERREPREERSGGARWWADGERESGAGGVYIPRRGAMAASSACWFCASLEVSQSCSYPKAYCSPDWGGRRREANTDALLQCCCSHPNGQPLSADLNSQ